MGIEQIVQQELGISLEKEKLGVALDRVEKTIREFEETQKALSEVKRQVKKAIQTLFYYEVRGQLERIGYDKSQFETKLEDQNPRFFVVLSQIHKDIEKCYFSVDMTDYGYQGYHWGFSGGDLKSTLADNSTLRACLHKGNGKDGDKVLLDDTWGNTNNVWYWWAFPPSELALFDEGGHSPYALKDETNRKECAKKVAKRIDAYIKAILDILKRKDARMIISDVKVDGGREA